MVTPGDGGLIIPTRGTVQGDSLWTAGEGHKVCVKFKTFRDQLRLDR
jgi:hypothetical protein